MCNPSPAIPNIPGQTTRKEKRHVELLKAHGTRLEFFVSEGMLDENHRVVFFVSKWGMSELQAIFLRILKKTIGQ